VLSAEFMLMNVLRRAKQLAIESQLWATPALSYFLTNEFTLSDFESLEDPLEYFSKLDDFDVFTALKVWSGHPDKVLSFLSDSIVNRHLFKIIMSSEPFDYDFMAQKKNAIMNHFNLNEENASFLLIDGKTSNHAYHPGQSSINIIYKDGSVKDISEASDQLNISVLSHPVTKYFVCFPKQILA